MNTATTGTQHGSKVVHLASDPVPFSYNGDTADKFYRACGINQGVYGGTFLMDASVADRPVEDITCKRCRTLAA